MVGSYKKVASGVIIDIIISSQL